MTYATRIVKNKQTNGRSKGREWKRCAPQEDKRSKAKQSTAKEREWETTTQDGIKMLCYAMFVLVFVEFVFEHFFGVSSPPHHHHRHHFFCTHQIFISLFARTYTHIHAYQYIQPPPPSPTHPDRSSVPARSFWFQSKRVFSAAEMYLLVLSVTRAWWMLIACRVYLVTERMIVAVTHTHRLRHTQGWRKKYALTSHMYTFYTV